MAPKFPTPHNLMFLMLYSRIGCEDTFYQAGKTLEQMRRGESLIILAMDFPDILQTVFYLVPHFEKMLYDNALADDRLLSRI